MRMRRKIGVIPASMLTLMLMLMTMMLTMTALSPPAQARSEPRGPMGDAVDSGRGQMHRVWGDLARLSARQNALAASDDGVSSQHLAWSCVSRQWTRAQPFVARAERAWRRYREGVLLGDGEAARGSMRRLLLAKEGISSALSMARECSRVAPGHEQQRSAWVEIKTRPIVTMRRTTTMGMGDKDKDKIR